MKAATLSLVVAAAALAAACAAPPPDRQVGQRVLPDTRVVAEHFQHAVAMQGAYGFQMAARRETRPLAAPKPPPAPEAPSWWVRLWPAAAAASAPSPPSPSPSLPPAATSPPPPVSAPAATSLWEHFWPPLKSAPPAAGTTVAEAHPPPASPVAVAAATPRPSRGEGSGLSEFRIGALKHAVAFGHRAKEQGMDGNVEALFKSPDWLTWAWSPRPHLGLTANASTRDTDFLYGGLTWEWWFWNAMFFDFGFGVSVHDGMLDNSMITGKARNDRREFGCRALFRESVEIGYRFLERHSLSLIWAHHSHGSLCNEENEGIDNAGLRYGYRM